MFDKKIDAFYFKLLCSTVANQHFIGRKFNKQSIKHNFMVNKCEKE